ncbi:ABC transporter substrate-binding protein [Paenibacillus thalictri]|uniref:ABC transporter substrate-binding protein n=1 Tax=Paenibacillus thalictri TaxID=2527873 RepID=A0A4Q9DQI2_9BACL|nr:ABC transporter substrate-binding protein [Paenibacillus thalictri]TBL78678.1 ABC transporter substrate-binding protein [Paenibacillus thalictri]
MKLESHYIRLRQQLPSSAETASLDITLDEIAAALGCTHRNAVLLLKRMSDNGWISWSPERGRGKKSKLTFLARTEDVIIQLAQDLVQKKDLRGALEQMNVSEVPATLKDHFHNWLNGHFGHSSELRNDKRIDRLRFPVTSKIATLDPLHMNFAAESQIVNQLFDSLVRYNRVKQTTEPHLAHAWETDDGRTAWTFYLRKGVLFHHGRELTADDVVYSLHRLKTSPSRLLYRWVYEQMDTIEALDPITVRIRLHEPNELFLPFLGTNRASIVPKDICEERGDRFGSAPIGTGPFRLSRHDASISVLEAFPSYFQGRAHLDEVELWHLPDMQAAEAPGSMESFQIIHNYRLPEEPSEGWNQAERSGATCKFVTFNLLKQGPLENEEVRAAVYETLSPGSLLRELKADNAAPLVSFVGEAADDADHGAANDPEASRTRLFQAGYRGETIRLCTIPHYEQDALLLQQLARQSGLKLEVMLLPVEDFKGERRLHADLLLFSLILDNDVELRLIDLYNSMQNHLKPEVKALVRQRLKRILGEPSRELRLELFREIETALTDRRQLLFLYRRNLRTVFHSSVKGISLDSPDNVQFKNIWFKL